jgi:manganese oxidase
MTRASFLALVALAPIQSVPANAQGLPVVEPNDLRATAGRLVDGVVRIELEALDAEWYPRGPSGPRLVTPAFAEVGGPPQVPGPLIRASAGTPIHVTVRNTLDRPIAVRGLTDRGAASDASPAAALPIAVPAFALVQPLVLGPGETGQTRFTPTADVSSFYYAHAVPPGNDGSEFPMGTLQEGAFMGVLVIDPPGAAPPPERVFLITRWGAPDEPLVGVSWKLMLNGRSWPFTERLDYTVGDTVRWRVINASMVDHPMHLHGFYFTVDAVGDTDADTTYAPGAGPLAVTHLMEEHSSLRLTWVPDEPGNWLFHCHLIRHMGEIQRFAVERAGHASPASADMNGHDMDTMAGLVTGITVRPGPGGEAPEEDPVRRIHLWTGQRPDVFDGHPELAFVVQEDAVPPPDSTQVPGSPLVLTRGELTEIVVHNRFDFPLSVHWHGLELRSLYDGVGGWSGHPGMTRPPIAPGDSVRVLITPRRAGTFMYHIHGEAGHELSQGLYGPFLVLEPGKEWDPDADRVFLLAERGAERDGVPSINGRTWPEPERFQPGRTYRLRFLHISPDAFKRVRLLRDGEPVRWRPIAKDGADLPDATRELSLAELGIGVGETYDMAWTPETSGIHVLEVTTEFYPGRGGRVTQRVAFGVGDASDAELDLPCESGLPIVAVPAAERSRYIGTFVGHQPGNEQVELAVRVWEEGDRLYSTGIRLASAEGDGARLQLFHLGDHTFAPGQDLDGLIHSSETRYRFGAGGEGLDRLDIVLDGGFVLTLERVLDHASGVGEAGAQDAGERAEALALTNVTVIDGTGSPPRPRMTVLVRGDRIAGVFPATEAPIPASAEKLDLSGRYLIPGLINTHVHLPMLGWTRDSVATGLERMLRAGVTTVREMAGDARLAAELNRATLIEGASLPDIHYAVRMAGPTFYERTASRSWIGYPAGTAPWAQAVTAETDLARAVALAAGTGASGLKLYADLDADVVRRLVAQAHRQGMKAWAHGTVFPTGPLEAIRAGVDGLSHICFLFWGLQPVVAASMAERAPYDPDDVDLNGGPFQELLREMRVHGVVLDATARNASRNPGAHAAGCTPELLNASLRAAHRAGVWISTGTDYVLADGDPDPTLFTEIEYLVGAGVLSPLEAITAATLNGARAIGIQERYGTIEAGKVADLVVLAGDPTQDIGALRSVVAVFKEGRQVSRPAAALNAARSPFRSPF